MRAIATASPRSYSARRTLPAIAVGEGDGRRCQRDGELLVRKPGESISKFLGRRSCGLECRGGRPKNVPGVPDWPDHTGRWPAGTRFEDATVPPWWPTKAPRPDGGRESLTGNAGAQCAGEGPT